MEAIKNAIGLGSTTTATTEQQGREPVNGVAGSGVAGEPYDQGNAEDATLGGKAPQHTDPSTDYSTNPAISSTPSTTTSGLTSSTPSNTATSVTSGVTAGVPSGLTSSDAVTPTAASATSPSGPAVEPTSSNTTSGPHASDLANKADPRVDSDNDRHTSSLAGTTPSASTVTPSTTTPSATTSDITSSDTTDPMHAHQDIPDRTVGSSAPSHSLTGSRASIAPTKPDHTNAPLKPAEKGGDHGINPSAIPTAGGKKIGEDAYVERKSMQADSSPLTATTNLPTETSTNTARNVGTADATGVGASSGVGHEEKKASIGSGSSASDHKEKKGLVEKIKEKVHHHKEKHGSDH